MFGPCDFNSYPEWTICPVCNQGYWDYGTGCPHNHYWQFNSGSYFYMPTLTTFSWNGWNIIQKEETSFMYKIEDDWFIWTETTEKEKWENGIIYKTKNFFDFMEYVIDFTGLRPVESFTTSTQDIEE